MESLASQYGSSNPSSVHRWPAGDRVNESKRESEEEAKEDDDVSLDDDQNDEEKDEDDDGVGNLTVSPVVAERWILCVHCAADNPPLALRCEVCFASLAAANPGPRNS